VAKRYRGGLQEKPIRPRQPQLRTTLFALFQSAFRCRGAVVVVARKAFAFCFHHHHHARHGEPLAQVRMRLQRLFRFAERRHDAMRVGMRCVSRCVSRCVWRCVVI